LTSGNGDAIPASEAETEDPDDESRDVQPDVDELQDGHDADGDGHEAAEHAHDPNGDGEVETGLGWTVDADGHNT
jgi:hypothetical protein